MILQALLSIAIVAVIAGAILTSALVNAKVAAHQTATRLATAALSRGTDEFVNWAQRYVAKHGAATTWPTTPIVDQPVAACETLALTIPSCETNVTNVTDEYQIRGSEAKSKTGPDPVTNLQSALNEQRVSALITSTITNDSIVIAPASQVVTLRIFNSSPFAVLTGIRDIHADAGPEFVYEGDTGGYRDPGALTHRATPNPEQPMDAQDTTISVTMSCTNSKMNSNMMAPTIDNNYPGNDGLPWGASGGRGYESPCTPEYNFSTNPSPPPDAPKVIGNNYAVGSFVDSSWNSNEFGFSITNRQ